MGLKHLCGYAAGFALATVGLSGTAFAAAGDFTFSTVLSQGTVGTTTIVGNQINTTNASNFFSFTNGADVSSDNGAGAAGTSIVLTNYNSTAPSATTGNVSDGFIDAITLTDTNTGTSQTKFLTGTYNGTLNTTSATLNQFFDLTQLTFTFSDGTYVLNYTGTVSPGPPGGSQGSTGANVKFTSNGAPEPSALMLVVPGVLGMVGFARRRKSN